MKMKIDSEQITYFHGIETPKMKHDSETFDNPFGSFRHVGKFPSSLLDDSRSSDSQMLTPETSNSLPFEDSTHMYINLHNRSDLGMVKSTKFWESLAKLEESCLDDSVSEAESFGSSLYGYDRTPRSFGDSSTDDLDCEVTLGSRSSGDGQSDSRLDDQTRSRKDVTEDFYVSYNPPSRDLSRISSGNSELNSINSAQLICSVNNRMDKWIQKLTAPTKSSDQKSSETKGSLGCLRSDFGMANHEKQPMFSFKKHSTSSVDDISSLKLSPISKLKVKLTENSKVAACSTLDNSVFHFSTRNPKPCHHGNNNTVDSDASAFMQRHLVNVGVGGRKISVDRRRNLARKLRRLGKFLQKMGPKIRHGDML